MIEECNIVWKSPTTARPWALKEPRSVRFAILRGVAVTRRMLLFEVNMELRCPGKDFFTTWV